MSKIIKAINAMVSNPNLISDAKKYSNIIYFLYKGVYKWSIATLGALESNYRLCYYAGEEDLSDIINFDNYDFENAKIIIYNSEDFKTKEADESFAELYLTVSEKLYDIDKALDDIINE